jgi:hypothetical protein
LGHTSLLGVLLGGFVYERIQKNTIIDPFVVYSLSYQASVPRHGGPMSGDLVGDLVVVAGGGGFIYAHHGADKQTGPGNPRSKESRADPVQPMTI